MSQLESETMDVCTEAKRIMVQALGKMYTLRTQRGGLRLHRSLLITLAMKSARDIYHSYRKACEQQEQQEATEVATESCRTSTDTVCVPENDNSLASKTQETQDCLNTNVQADLHDKDTTGSENKENLSSTRPDRHSRKRRGKAAVEPDFLPCKRAKMEAEEVRRNSHSASLRTTCGGVKDTLTHIPMPRSIVSFWWGNGAYRLPFRTWCAFCARTRVSKTESVDILSYRSMTVNPQHRSLCPVPDKARSAFRASGHAVRVPTTARLRFPPKHWTVAVAWIQSGLLAQQLSSQSTCWFLLIHVLSSALCTELDCILQYCEISVHSLCCVDKNVEGASVHRTSKPLGAFRFHELPHIYLIKRLWTRSAVCCSSFPCVYWERYSVWHVNWKRDGAWANRVGVVTELPGGRSCLRKTGSNGN